MKAELETLEFKPVQAEDLEEIDRRLAYVNDKLEKLEGRKPDSTNNLGILVFLFLAIAGGFFVVQYNPQLTGLVTYTYTFEKYLNLSTSTNQILNLELSGPPNSLRISGVLIGNGNASVYLLVNNSRILVGEIKGNQTKLGGITGMTVNEVVNENNTATNTSLILMNESAIPDNVSIVLNESAGDLSNNMNLDRELAAAQSADKHKNVSVLLINPFDGVCVDTCSLTNVGANISLEIEVYSATLNLSKIMYTVEKEAEKKKNKPYWNSSVDAFIVNGRSYINLSKYFVGSGLSFLVSPAENVSLSINGSILDIVPAVGIIGERLVTLFASDLESTVSKDITLVVNSSVVAAEVVQLLNESHNVTGRNVTANVTQLNMTVNGTQQNIIVNATVNVTNPTENLTQGKAVIGKPVKWIKRVRSLDKIEVPDYASNVSVVKIIGKERFKLNERKLQKKLLSVLAENVTSNETAESFEVTYETEAPIAKEFEVSAYNKRIVVSSTVHYSDVLTYTDIPDSRQANIRLYWLVNDSRIDVTERPEFSVNMLDTDSSGLIDRLEWVTPHLSNQTFEISITILNVQSYPMVGGNWTVEFNTTGVANLSISASNGTTYGEDVPFDLKWLVLKCGDNVVNASFNGSVVFVRDWNCSLTGYQVVKANTAGVHTQKFVFGDNVEYAFNTASGVTCDAGTSNTTVCNVSTNYTITNQSYLWYKRLNIKNNGALRSAIGTWFYVNASSIYIYSGGKIAGSAKITATNMTMFSGSLINVSGKGYPGGKTNDGENGYGPGLGTGDNGGGAGGAGFGGKGGVGESSAAGGTIYGNILVPNVFGSGGGAGDGATDGGNGGGFVYINATNTLLFNGTIIANGVKGEDGTTSKQIDGAGGGSGGSVFVSASVLRGNGSIYSQGGAGGTDVDSDGGGGAGGRIAVLYSTGVYTGRNYANGGSAGGSGAYAGGAGSVFVCGAISGMSCPGSYSGISLITKFGFNFSINVTRKIISVWNMSTVLWNETTSNGTCTVTYNITGVNAGKLYYIYNRSVSFTQKTSSATGKIASFSVAKLGTNRELKIEQYIAYLNSSIGSPANNTIVSRYGTFVVNSSVKCLGASSCGDVGGGVRFNKSSLFANTYVNISKGGSPFFIKSSSGGSVEPAFGWNRTFAYGIEARGVAVDSQDNVVVTGYTGGTNKYLTVKYNSSGGWLWNRTFAFGYQASSVAVDSQDNVVVTGYTATPYRFLTVKYNRTGGWLWNRTFTFGALNAYAFGVAIDSQNNIIVTGYKGNAPFDVLTVKYNSSGGFLWNRTYTYPYSASAVAVDSKDSIFVAGSYFISTHYYFIVAKYNSSGDRLWNQTFRFGYFATDVAVDSQDNVILTGSTQSPIRFLTVEYNSSGGWLWNRTFAFGYKAYGVAVDSQDNIIVTGYTSDENYLTVKYNKTGGWLWNRTFSYGNWSNHVAVDSQDNIIVTGHTDAGGKFLTAKYLQGKNPRSCGPLSAGQTCNLTWVVNATGPLLNKYFIDTYAYSSLSYVSSNHTEDRRVCIGSCDDPPSVVLDSPVSGSAVPGSSVTFFCNVTDNLAIKNVSLYTNLSGTWKLNSTKDISATKPIFYRANFTVTGLVSVGKWNCLAYDNASLGSWASSNFTFRLGNSLNASLFYPHNNTAVSRFKTFVVNATVKCLGLSGSSCNGVFAGVRYNKSSVAANTYINVSKRAISPFKIKSYRGGDVKPVLGWNRTFALGFLPYGVAVDSQDSIILTGGTSSDDFVTVKYNSSGSWLWNRTFAYGYSAVSVAADSQNNVIVTGYQNSTGGNFLTVKYNSTGGWLWNRTFIYGKYARDVTVDSQDNIIVTGSTESPTKFLTVMYNSYGSWLWNRTFAVTSVAYGVTVDSQDNIIVTGTDVNSDILTVKYNHTGGYLWNRTFTHGNVGLDVAVDSQDNIIISGYNTTGGQDDYLTIKYNSTGGLLWNRTLAAGYRAYGVAVDSKDNVIITGSNYTQAQYDFLTVKYNSTGGWLWNTTFRFGYYAYDVAVDSQDNDIVVGSTGISDFLTVKYLQGKNPQRCSVLSVGQSCNLTWVVNATGPLYSKYYVDINSYSNSSDVAGNDSANHKVCIGSYCSASGLNISLHNPTNNTAVSRFSTFVVNATVKCLGSAGTSCGDVYVYGRYNRSASKADTLINSTKLASPIYAQDYSWPMWNRSLGIGQYARGVAVDSQNNVLVTGYNSSSSTRWLTVKYDSSGGVLWNRSFIPGFYARAVAVDSQDNVLVAGSNTTSRLLTLKYSSSGAVLWNRSFAAGSIAYGVAVDSQDNVIVTGYNTTSRWLTVKYSSSGGVLWNRTFGNGKYSYGVAVDSQDNIIVTGYNTSGNPRWLTVKYSSSGGVLWNRSFAAGNTAFGVAVDSQDNIIVAGYNVSSNWLTVKYNSSGAVLWNRTFGTGSVAYGVAVDSQDNIIVAGYNTSNNWLTVKYSSSGGVLWNRSFGKGKYAQGVAVDSQDNIILAGYNISTSNRWLTVKYSDWLTRKKCSGLFSGSVCNVSLLVSPTAVTGSKLFIDVFANSSLGNSVVKAKNSSDRRVCVGLCSSVEAKVDLLRPEDFGAANVSAVFSCNASGSGLRNLSFWINRSGVWKANSTVSFAPAYTVSNNFNVVLGFGSYKWGCSAFDDVSGVVWSVNRSVRVIPGVLSVSFFVPLDNSFVLRNGLFLVDSSVLCTGVSSSQCGSVVGSVRTNRSGALLAVNLSKEAVPVYLASSYGGRDIIGWNQSFGAGKYARAVAVDSQDNVLVTGYNTSDIWLTVKYSSSGAVLWNRSFGTGSYAWGVAVDSKDNVLVTGYNTSSRWLTVKYSSSGAVLWNRTLGTGSYAYGVAVDSQDNVLVTGYNTSTRWLTVKYNSSGAVLWNRSFATGSIAYGVAVDSQDNIIVAGYNTSSSRRWLTVKYSSSGAVLWNRSFGRGYYAFGVAVDSQDNVIVTGYNTSTRWLTVKYNSSGAVLWNRTLGTGKYAQGVAVDSQDNIIVAGYNTSSSARWLTVKYNSSGAVLWNRTFRKGSTAYGVAVDSQDNVIVTGYNTSSYWLTVKYLFGRNPRLCSFMYYGSVCDLWWYLNASGGVGERFGLDVLFNSSYALVGATNSDTHYVTISVGPNVTLSSPADGSNVGVPVVFKCDLSDSVFLKNVSLYANFSGAWELNQTLVLTGNKTKVYKANFTFDSIALGSYKWNCLAYDNASLGSWGSSNFTFRLVGALNASLFYPLNNTVVSRFNTFVVNATVKCLGVSGLSCGDVFAGVRYNKSSPLPNTYVNVSKAASPFYIKSYSGGSVDPALGWNRTFAYGSIAYGVAVDSQDNVVVTGQNTSSGASARWLTVKYNSSGAVKWNRTFGKGYHAYGVAVDSKDNIIVTGINTSSGASARWLTVKYNSSGAVLWNWTFGRGYVANGVAVDSQDNVIVTGYNETSKPRWLTVKYNSSGAVLWNRSFGKGYYTYGVAVDSQDNLLVTGRNTSARWLTVKYNSSGAVLWNRTFSKGYYARGVAVDSQDNVLVTGINTSAYLLTVKYNSSGAVLWNKSFGKGNYSYGVAVDSQDNVIVTGYNESNRWLTVKYNSSGAVKWNRTFSKGYIASGVAVDSQDNVLVTGYNESSTSRWLTVKYLQGKNPQRCSVLSAGQSCNLTWVVNATGPLLSKYYVDINSYSSSSDIASNDSKNRLVRIGPPATINITFVSKTPSNNARTVDNWIFVNATINSTNAIDSCWLRWNNRTHTINYSMTKTLTGTFVYCSRNMSTKDGLRYNYTVFANDSLHNVGNSSRRTNLENTKPPAPTHNKPTNASRKIGNNMNVSWTAGGTDANGDTITYYWRIDTDPTPIAPFTCSGSTTSTNSSRCTTSDGTRYYWHIYASDGYEIQTATTPWNFFENTKPTISSVGITPTNPLNDNNLNCTVSGGNDAEGDSIQYYFRWYNKSVLTRGVLKSQTSDVVGKGNTSEEQNWNCTVIPYDSFENGTALSAKVTIASSPISVKLIAPLSGANFTDTNATLRCWVNFTSSTIKYIKNVSLYTNRTGTWVINQSVGLGATKPSKYTANFSLTSVAVGSYKWNCLAYDNSSQSAWANNNWTFWMTDIIADCVGTDPRRGNHWTIDDNTICIGKNISLTRGFDLIVNGNLTIIRGLLKVARVTVNKGGRLSIVDSKHTFWQNSNLTIEGTYNLINSTLRLNGTSDGQIGIDLMSSGVMKINESSNITNGVTAAAHFFFLAKNSSNFSMQDSYLSESGWQDAPKQRGLELNTTALMLKGNTITNCYAGITLYSNRNKLTNCSFSSNIYGVLIYSSSNQSMMNLSIRNNTIGIAFFGSATESNISRSTIAANSGAGIYLLHSGTSYADANRIYDNFLNNTINLNSSSASNTNLLNLSRNLGKNIIGGSWLGGNYWTDPKAGNFSDSCYDGNADGICDYSYTPQAGNTDWLALTYVYNPNVSLVNPANHATAGNSVVLRCNARAFNGRGIKNVSVYTNISGSWTVNQTVALTASHPSYYNANFSLNVVPGSYKWNCLAYDNASLSDWGDGNRTFRVQNYGTLNITFYLPLNNTELIRYGLFVMNAIVKCNGTNVSCGDVYAYGRYNRSAAKADTVINITKLASPIYVQEYNWRHWNWSFGKGYYAYGVAVDSKDNIIVTGINTSSGASARWLTVKYNSSGGVLWNRSFGKGYYAQGVAVDSQDNVIVTGYNESINPRWLTVKYNSSGAMLWNRSFGKGNVASGVAVDSQDNVIVTGYNMSSRWLTVKYNSSGSVKWNRTFGKGYHAYGVAVDSQDNVIVTGFNTSSGTLARWLTVKYSGSGAVLWNRTWGNSYYAQGVAVDSHDNVIVTGSNTSSAIFGRWLTVKYSGSGAVLWNRTFGKSNVARGVAVDSQDNVIVTGYNESSIGTPRWLTVKYSSSGAVLWNRTYGRGYYAFGVAVDSQDNVIVTGYNTSTASRMLTVKYSDWLNPKKCSAMSSGDICNVSLLVSPTALSGSKLFIDVFANSSLGNSVVKAKNSSDRRVCVGLCSSVGAKVDLLRPADLAVANFSVLFSCNTSGSGIRNLSLWINRSGVWKANSTRSFVPSYNVSANYTVVLGFGSYKWGCSAFDEVSGVVWSVNRSVRVVPGVLSVSFFVPLNNSFVLRSGLFLVNSSVLCSGVSGSQCGSVVGSVRNNRSGVMQAVNFSKSAVPVYLDSSYGGTLMMGWNRSFGKGTYAYGVAVDSQDNVIVAGYNTSSYWLTVKYSSSGAVLWNRSFGRGRYAYGVAVDSQDNVIVAGYNTSNYWLTVKYSSSGAVLWNRSFGKGYIARGVAVDSQDNVFVTGYNESGTSRWLTVKYSSSGAVLWNRTFGRGKYAYGVAVDSQDNVIVTGINTSGTSRWLTVKYSSSGAVLWNRTFGKGTYARGVAVDSQDNVIVTGYNGSSPGWSTVKYNGSGAVLWNRSFGKGTVAYGVAVDSQDNVIVAGYNTSSSQRLLTVKYSGSGAVLWNRTFGNGYSAYGVAVDSQDNVVVTGYNTSTKWLTVKYLFGRNQRQCSFMYFGSVCDLWWYLNASGGVGERFGLDALYNSSYALVGAKNSDTRYVTIAVGPNVTLSSPADGSNLGIPVVFKCNISGSVFLKNVSLYTNFSGTWKVNQTLVLTGNKTGVYKANFTKSPAGGSYKWNCLAYDNRSLASQAVGNWTVKILGPPIVSLSSPASGSSSVVPLVLKCNATADVYLRNISLYTNFSGTWQLNRTLKLTGNRTAVYKANFTFGSVAKGSYKWNCLAYDNVSLFDWADANWTFLLQNSAPIVAIGPNITPANPKMSNNLNCSFTITDANIGDILYANYSWYNGSIRKFYGRISVANNVSASIGLSAANTTLGEIWNCSITPYDETNYGATKSAKVTIGNTPPNITLIWPNKGNSTTDFNRTPKLRWRGYDADGDKLNFTVLIECMAADCGGYLERREINITYENWTVDQELQVDAPYNWTVRAFDGTNYSSWSAVWNFTVASHIAISLTTNHTQFGNLFRLNEVNTTVAGDNINPLVVRNNGNVHADIMLKADSQLWETAKLNTSSFQFMAGNAIPQKTFDSAGSVTTWQNVSDYKKLVVHYLNYTDNVDNATIELKIVVPYDEGPGVRSSKLTVSGEPT